MHEPALGLAWLGHRHGARGQPETRGARRELAITHSPDLLARRLVTEQSRHIAGAHDRPVAQPEEDELHTAAGLDCIAKRGAHDEQLVVLMRHESQDRRPVPGMGNHGV